MAQDHADGLAGARSLRGMVGATIAFTVLAVVVLAIGWTWQFQRTSEQSAIKGAARWGELGGRAALAPYLTDDLLAGDPIAIQNLGSAGRALIDEGGAANVKVWAADGKILWSNQAELIGRTFPLENEERAQFNGADPRARLSELDEEADDLETASGEKRLLQVYFSSQTESGTPVVIETHYPTSLIDSRAAEQRRSFLPVLVGGLGLLIVVQLPLARALTHRLKRLQTERENLLERVIASGDIERRRIAAEVHDGAVQDLIGITFSLSAAANEAPPPMNNRLNGLATATRHTVRSLRSLLNSIYPVEVPEMGWAAGLDDSINALRERGVTVNIDVPEMRLSPANELLLLRVGREALRNVDAHAQASRVDIKMTKVRNDVTLSITDNGIGFDKETALSQRQVGHLGLQLLRDLAVDMGADLVVDSAPGTGTTVHLELEES